MNRLTKCLNKQEEFYGKDENWVDEDEQFWARNVIDKLGHLEDLEEELGCPLDVVVKLFKNHIYYAEKPNHKGKVYEMNFPHISFIIKGGNAGGMEYKDNSFIVGGTCYDFYNMKRQEYDGWDVHLKDYKKTWWLKETKEE